MKKRHLLLLVLSLLVISFGILLHSMLDFLPVERSKFSTIKKEGVEVSAYIFIGNATVGDEVQIIQTRRGQDTFLAVIADYNFIVDFFFKSRDTVAVVVRDTSEIGIDKTIYIGIDNKK